MYSYRYKLKVVSFYSKFGLKNTLDHFRVKSKTTILAWNKIVRKGDKKELKNNKTIPHTFYIRENNWNPLIYDLIKTIIFDHPTLTKEKVFIRLIRKLSSTHELVINSYPKSVSKITEKILNLNKQWLDSLDSFEKKNILKVEKIKIPSIATIGRIIKDLKNKPANCGGLINKDKKQVSFFASTSSFRVHSGGRGSKNNNKKKNQINRTPTVKNAKSKGLKPEEIKTKANHFKPGERLQQDTIEVRFSGQSIYLFGLTDLNTRLSLYVAYNSKKSQNTVDFVKRVKVVFGNLISIDSEYQNDNGSEYQRHFKKFLKELNITQYFNYKESPKMNAYIEKTNDIIQKEFVYPNLYLLKQKEGLKHFNKKLMDWNIYYNTKREHGSLDYYMPLEYLEEYTENNLEFKKGWARS